MAERGSQPRGRSARARQPGAVHPRVLAAARAGGIDYNLIEAFDQPWKRRLEGTVGGHWGLLDAAGAAKFPLRGALAEEPTWHRAWIAGAVLGGLMALAARAGVLPFVRRRPGAVPIAAAGLAGAASGGVLWAQLGFLAESSRTALEWAVGGLLTVSAGAAAVLLGGAIARAIGAPAPGADATGVLRPAAAIVRARAVPGDPGAWLALARLLFLFAAAAQCLMLVFDARYRDFPLALFAVPAAGFALLALTPHAQRPAGVEERLLAMVTVAAVPMVAVQETLANAHALAWCGLCLLLGGAALWPTPAGRRTREHEHA
ncbi:MAG: hypothetical protein M5U08_24145 [Burkholderiales bacterium]|nr:hypothetical protein [Burkholderiales bacterium]